MGFALFLYRNVIVKCTIIFINIKKQILFVGAIFLYGFIVRNFTKRYEPTTTTIKKCQCVFVELAKKLVNWKRFFFYIWKKCWFVCVCMKQQKFQSNTKKSVSAKYVLLFNWIQNNDCVCECIVAYQKKVRLVLQIYILNVYLYIENIYLYVYWEKKVGGWWNNIKNIGLIVLLLMFYNRNWNGKKKKRFKWKQK